MNRCKVANDYHDKGFNCCQSVVAAFSDLTHLSEQESFNICGGFGAGAQTGELCGAVVGGVMVLGLLCPVDMAEPVKSKQRTGALGKEFQHRFVEKFGHLRCQDLIHLQYVPDDATPAAREMQLTKHCPIMIVTAVELVEELIRESNLTA